MTYRDFQEFDFPALERLEKKLLGDQPAHRYRTNPAALRFFSRSGHSFLAHFAGEVHGFVLAQAVWQGDQVTVLITRLLADSEEAYRGLIAAVVKSAYDAGVYEVALHIDAGNAPVVRALSENGFTVGPLLLAVRVLGSRGLRGEVGGVLE
ncbi:MAG: DUF1999 domain-containing protein [Meiothermus sp.]